MTKRMSSLVTIWIFLFLALIYLVLAHLTRFSYADRSPFAYYNYLVEAFLQGHAYIEKPPYILDLSLFQNKYYLYWGPAPALFILPFYLFLGKLEASDFVYSIAAALLNIILFYILIQEFLKYFRVSVRKTHIYLVWIGFALCSPNLYCAINGGVWQTSQVIGMTYLLSGLICFFKYLNQRRTFVLLLLSVLFFNLSWLSRFGMSLYLLLFIYAGVTVKDTGRRILLTVVPITMIFVVLFLFYNHIRFGSVFQVGTRYQQTELWVSKTEFDRQENIMLNRLHQEGKQYSIKYIPRGIYYYFLNPVRFSLQQPYVITDSMGNGIFFIYPVLLLVFGIFFKKITALDSKKKMFLITSACICGIYIFSLLIYVGTGYHQVGNRYVFDIVPLILLVTLFCIEGIPSVLPWGLVVYGSSIHIVAVIAYYLGKVPFSTWFRLVVR